MRQRLIVVVAAVLAIIASFAIGWYARRPGVVINSVFHEKAWPISDLKTGVLYHYYDWHTCQSTDGTALVDWHFAGKDRSLRNQLTPRGVQVINDSSLPRGYMRIYVNPQRVVEGHEYGGDAVVQFNGPIRGLNPVEACGPERGVAP